MKKKSKTKGSIIISLIMLAALVTEIMLYAYDVKGSVYGTLFIAVALFVSCIGAGEGGEGALFAPVIGLAMATYISGQTVEYYKDNLLGVVIASSILLVISWVIMLFIHLKPKKN